MNGLPGSLLYSGSGITGTRTADADMRLDDITWRLGSAANSPVLLRNDYILDARNRRTAATREDGVNWSYGYNDRGEVTSASRGGQNFTYQYDEIGNRIDATETGVNDDGAQTVEYTTTNALNQYTAITNPDPGKRKIKGQANADATVTVTQTGTDLQPVSLSVTRSGTAFSATASAATTSAPAFAKVTIEGRKEGAGVNGGAIVARKESGFYFPPKDEALAYDEDGNLIQDGRWNWEWDGENRLKAMETNATAAAAGVPRQRLEFTYDSQSRRIRKLLKEWDAAQQTFVLKRDTRFLYDG